jgi:GDPmannose 4,6-dehydratase
MKQLGWEPKVKFEELVQIMVESDLKLAETELHMSRRSM